MAETAETPAVEQPLAKIEKPKAAPKTKKALKLKLPGKGKSKEKAYLPVLVEFTYAFAAITLIVVFLVIAVLAFLGDTTLLEFVLRESVSMMVLGGLFLVVARLVTNGMFSVAKDDEAERKREEEEKQRAEEAEQQRLAEEESAKAQAELESAAPSETPESLERPFVTGL